MDLLEVCYITEVYKTSELLKKEGISKAEAKSQLEQDLDNQALDNFRDILKREKLTEALTVSEQELLSLEYNYLDLIINLVYGQGNSFKKAS